MDTNMPDFKEWEDHMNDLDAFELDLDTTIDRVRLYSIFVEFARSKIEGLRKGGEA